MAKLRRQLKLCLLRRAPWPILVFTALLFAGSLNYEPLLLLDDGHYVALNPNLGFTAAQLKALILEPVLGLWTPLPMLTYLIDYAVAGVTPWVCRLQNLLWHLAAVAFAYFLVRELRLSRRAAFFLTLLFAIHPQRVESVVWLAERKDVVTAAFFFAALLFFVRDRQRGRFFGLPALFCVIGALYSKQLAIALPAVMFLLEVHRTRKWDFRVLLRLWPYHLAVALYLLQIPAMLRSVSSGSTLTSHPGVTAVLVLRNYLLYAFKVFLPLELNPVYPPLQITPAAVAAILGAALAAAVLLLCFGWKKPATFRYDLLPFLLIFGGLLLPVAGFVPFSHAEFGDRYNYIPSLFLMFPAALAAAKWLRRPMVAGLLTAYALLLAVLNYNYQLLWKNDASILMAACDVATPNLQAAGKLAWLYYEAGEEAEALALLDRAGGSRFHAGHIARQIEVYRDFFAGMIAYRRGDQESAWRCLTRIESAKLDALGDNAMTAWLTTLAKLDLARHDPAGAAARYDRLVELYRGNDPFQQHFFAGVAAMLRRDYAAAVHGFEAAAALIPDDPETQKNLAAARELLRKEKAASDDRQPD